jgi:glycosyltransferase involved in cell wall biosynthesis
LDYLEKEGIESRVWPALPQWLWENYNKSPDLITKSHFYLYQVFRRLGDILKIHTFDAVFLQRDIIVHLYPFLEKLIALRQRRIIFDFDDAIYLYPAQKKTGIFFNLFWDRKKIERILKLSCQVIAGNNFLRDYALQFNRQVNLIPTSIDLKLYPFKAPLPVKSDKLTIGWVGSPGTFGYLENIFPALIKLSKEIPLRLVVVGSRGASLAGLDITYRDWNLNSEIEDICSFDLGVMPLSDDPWSRGKSATKLLQYMAAGVPAIASPVGVNSEIIKDGINGFLAGDDAEWREKILCLARDKALAQGIALEARKTVERDYSVEVNAAKLAKVIREAAAN